MNSAENEYEKRYHEAEVKVGQHERAIHILRLKTRIHKDLLHVHAVREARYEALGRLERACSHGRTAIQQELSEIQTEKKIRGDDARHLMLAYGFLRGKTYDQIESCTPGNEPDLEKVWARLPDKGFSGELSLKQQLEDWLPKRDQTTEYILKLPAEVPRMAFFGEDMARARYAQHRALKAWGKLRRLDLPKPQVSWGPCGSIMFSWQDEDFYLELEFTDNVEFFVKIGETGSDSDLSLSKAIKQIQTHFEQKEAA